ncbi:MAG TPA: ABC transporter permease [Candidatus Angelobacter sp.]
MRLTDSFLGLLKDVRYGYRQLRRTPGFAIVAVVTLALGIGANTAVFSVMNAVLLRYLPVPNPQQLVLLHYVNQPDNSSQTGFGDSSLSEPAFEELRKQTAVFSDLVAFVPLGLPKIPVRIGDTPEEASADEVSGNFFSGLGVRIVRGRTFTLDDEKNHAQVAILGYSYWKRRFSADPGVFGQTVYIKSVPFTIIGVAASDFMGLEREKATEIWVPFQTNPLLKPWGAPAAVKEAALYGAPKWFYLMMVGRLQPNVSREGALAQLNPVYKQAVYSTLGAPKTESKPIGLGLTPLRGVEGLNRAYSEPCAVLMAMVALVLLIACSNVAMLLLARNANRQREFSVRLALGASRWAMLRQFLTESLLLVTLGGIAGWLFAIMATRTLAAWAKIDVNLDPDRVVLLFAVGICALAAFAFGIAPLRNAVRVAPGLVMKTSAAASTQDRHKLRAGHFVVGLQVSLCVMLLVGAGLLVRTLMNLENADLGLNARGLVVFGVAPPQTIKSDAEAVQFFNTVLERLRGLPDVESATMMLNRLGYGWSNNTGVYVDGVVPNGKKFAFLRWNPVGSDFVHTLQIPLVLGRDFTDADTAASPRAAIINQTFARNYIKDPNPIGHRIALFDELDKPNYTIVGVISDNKYTRVREEPVAMAYLPFTQVEGIATMQIELRTRGKPEAVLPEARGIVKEFGQDLPLLDPVTQVEQFDNSFSNERMFARLSIFFGLLAAILVATGLYGVMAYRVSRRTAEIGVRMALGAQRSQVLWMVLRESLLICLAGIVVGLPAAIACSRLLRSMLFNMTPGDPLTFVVALVGVAVVTLAATAMPARRASAVDPIVALRYE